MNLQTFRWRKEGPRCLEHSYLGALDTPAGFCAGCALRRLSIALGEAEDRVPDSYRSAPTCA